MRKVGKTVGKLIEMRYNDATFSLRKETPKMQNDELLSLINLVRERKCEMQTIELKAAEKGCPARIYDTLSGFSNQDSGGVIIFGVAEDRNYDIVGVYDAQDLQKKVTEQCKQMEPMIRPLFTVASYEGKTVVSAEIPGVDIAERPVFYRGVGRIKGSYIRVGESDEQMSEYEIYSYEAFKRKRIDELRVLEKNEFASVKEHEITYFLAKLRSKKPNLTELSDKKILALSGVYYEEKLTLAGLLLFGLYPQALYPQLCITAVVVPGYEIGDIGEHQERFIDNKKIEGTLSQMIDGAISFVRRNMRERTIIDENGKRNDKEEYPIKAIREIILNAVIHRDYSAYTEASPIRIMMFTDRIEVENPGGLYGRITINKLGKVGADTRNPYIASNLEILIDTENRFSGIPIVIKEMKTANLPPPVFENNRGVFKVTLYNEEKVENGETEDTLVERILAFCETPRTRSELEKFTGFSRYYTMSKIVQPLVDDKRLQMTIPDKPRSARQMFIRT